MLATELQANHDINHIWRKKIKILPPQPPLSFPLRSRLTEAVAVANVGGGGCHRDGGEHHGRLGQDDLVPAGIGGGETVEEHCSSRMGPGGGTGAGGRGGRV